jgi:hypothetical protein
MGMPAFTVWLQQLKLGPRWRFSASEKRCFILSCSMKVLIKTGTAVIQAS